MVRSNKEHNLLGNFRHFYLIADATKKTRLNLLLRIGA